MGEDECALEMRRGENDAESHNNKQYVASAMTESYHGKSTPE